MLPIKETPSQSSYDHTKIARDRVDLRSVENCIQHLSKLANGPSFQLVKPDTYGDYQVTENKGQKDLQPKPYWVDELWHEEVKLAPKIYRELFKIGSTRNRHIYELLYRREERADLQAMQEAARQAVRVRQAQQEAREEAVLQGLRGLTEAECRGKESLTRFD